MKIQSLQIQKQLTVLVTEFLENSNSRIRSIFLVSSLE